MRRIVLAYTGSLDSSVAVVWLSEKYGAEIVALTLDAGPGQGLEEVRDRALAVGAARAHVLDVRDEYARNYTLPALRAGALHQRRYPIGAALADPLMARKLVDLAAIEQADAIAHCPGAGSTRTRLDVAAGTLDPALTVLAPTRDWGMTRAGVIEYARTRGLPVPEMDEPVAPAKPPADDPREPASIELTFEQGVPTAINGVPMPLVELIASLGTIAGAHGVGRIEFHEVPAAIVLQAAHGDLQRAVTTDDASRFSRLVSLHYADVIHNGLWFTPMREALDAYVDKIQERVTGVARLELFKGDCRVVSRRSPFALDGQRAAAYDAGDPVEPSRRVITT